MRAVNAAGALVGAVLVLTVPLVVAHIVFYSTLGLSPDDVGLDFVDIAQRSLPGLLIVFALVSFALLSLYSIVTIMNVCFLSFFRKSVRRYALVVTVVLIPSSMALAVVDPLWPNVLLTIWLISILGLGAFELYPVGWRGLLCGVLLGAPLYALVMLALVSVLPVLMANVEAAEENLRTYFVGLALSVPMLGAVLAVVTLPAILAEAESRKEPGRLYVWLRRLVMMIPLKQAIAIFATFCLLGTYVLITLLAHTTASAIASGINPITPTTVTDRLIQYTYGLSASCVDLTPLEPVLELPDQALLVGSRGPEYVLILADGQALRVPRDVVTVQVNDQNECHALE